MKVQVSNSRVRAAGAALAAALVFAAFPAGAQAQVVTVTVGGQPLYLSPGPIERSGRVFVPLRGIFERLGATVVYQNGQINATRGQTTVSLHIGSTQALVAGQPQYIDVAPFIVGATTYVPLRFVAQSFGSPVDYNGTTRVVAIGPPPGGGGGGGYRPPPPPRPYPPPANPVQLRAIAPPPGSVVANRFVTISAEFTRQVRPASVRVSLDDNDITYRSNVSGYGFSYKPPAPLNFGAHGVRVSGVDVNGAGFARTWSFSTSGAPQPGPVELRNQRPQPGTKLADRFAVIGAEFSRQVQPGSVTVRLDGADITDRSGVSATAFSYKPPAPLEFGNHTVRVTGRGAGGASFDRAWSFQVIRTMPPAPGMRLTINQPGANDVVGRSFVVQGNTVGNASVRVT
ncbi:MAG TPA: copper amine oxidase N-terminal domain-containing protein, partial [Candidatus Tumulicola sp.]|nr:copper amine oxidase N-terminal domain-containing protein [Candidatus Tumulicola sp.]